MSIVKCNEMGFSENRRKTPFLTCLFPLLAMILLLVPASPLTAADDDAEYQVKPYSGPYNHPEIPTTKAVPRLYVGGNIISPMAGAQEDLVIDVCKPNQQWKLLKEYSNWKDVNRFGFYTDLGVGTAQTLIFSGPISEGVTVATSLADATTVGLWLLNDTDGNLVYSYGDSYLYTQRSLTKGSTATEHQWFMVYDVSAYKGTGATYNFICDTEDFSTTGDFDYLIYIDDNHTSSNFDHNDMIVGMVCPTNEAPEAACPGDTSVFLCSLGPVSIPGFGASDPDGNLAGITAAPGIYSGGTVTFTPAGAGLQTIRLIATDSQGLADTCFTDVTIVLNQPPVASCFSDKNDTSVFICNTSELICIPGFSASDPDNNLASVFAVGGTLTGDEICFTPVGGTNTIKLVAVDECGLADTCVTTVYVHINHAPTVTCPDDKNLFVCDLSEICIDDFLYSDIDNNLLSCSVDNGVLSGTEVCFTPVEGLNTITLTAVDSCGKTATCTTDIIVTLNNAPTATCPSNQELFVCDFSPITLTGFICDDPDDNLTSCSVNNGTLNGTSVTFTPVVGVNTITLTATDACGQTDNCVTTVTVSMNNAPTATCPSNQELFVCDFSPITLTGFICDDPDDNLTSCSVNNGTLNGTSVTFTPVVGVNTITLTATDACGQTDNCVTTVTVSMNNAPTATCTSNQELFVCDLSPITLNGFICDDPDDNLTSCSVNNGTLNGTSVTFTPVVGVNSITLTATDACGQTDNCVTTVTVSMNNPPTAACPANQELFVCDLSPITLNGFVCDDVDDNLTSCSVNNGTLNGTSVTFTPVVGVNTITLTATDACGQTDNCVTTVTVSMNNPPTAACPANQELFVCDLSPITLNGFVCDDVDDNLTSCSVNNGTLNGTSVTFTPVVGVNSITLTATDACGQTDNCVTTVTVSMNNPPTATCPSNQELFVCDLSPITLTGFVCDDVDDNLTSCSVNNGTLNGTSVTFTPVVGVNTVTLTATDACGQTDNCNTTITISLNDAPVASCPSGSTLFVCELAEICLDGFVCTDADDNLVSCTVNNGVLTGTQVCFTPVAGVNTITLTATDACGAVSTCVTTVTVNLNAAPITSCPANTQLAVCDLSPVCLDGFACSDPDNNLTSCSVSNGTLSGNQVCFTPVAGVNTITLTATDACGLTSSCMTDINVILNNPPSAACPSNRQLFVCSLEPVCIEGFICSDPDGNLTSCAVNNGTINGTSVCFTPVVGNNNIALTATDACGAIASCQTTIAVALNHDPTVTVPPSRDTLVCQAAPIVISGFTCADIDDNLTSCAVNKGTLGGGAVSFVPVAGPNVITLTATDACGRTATASTTINVTINTPPAVYCVGDTTLYMFELTEVCLMPFSCNDVDGNLISCQVTGGAYDDGEICFTPVEGLNTITVTATDACGEITTCQTIVSVGLVSTCPTVAIEKAEKVIQGRNYDVSVSIENLTYEIGGFDFLIAYDAAALMFIQASPAGFLVDCDWEYFAYRYGAQGNCEDACPSGLIRVLALAESNDGPNHPECLIPADMGQHGLFNLRFFVTSDRTLECMYIPIYFFWYDCGDNTLASGSGDTLFIDRAIYNFEERLIWDEFDDGNFPEILRPLNMGSPDNCLNADPDKPSPIRCVDFKNGGIDIVCADSIDARADLNLNGVSYEIADAVVFTNYFIYGLASFTVNIDGQVAASDANNDGIPLSVADLVYLIRVINGDAVAYDKLTPDAETAVFRQENGIIRTDAVLGAAAFVFEGNVIVTPAQGASNMELKSAFDGTNTRVLLYTLDKGITASGEILVAEGRPLSIEAADYSGNNYRIGNLPREFVLNSFPNPFNPATTIEMTLPESSEWSVDIFNVAGQKVAQFRGINEAGKVQMVWDAQGVSTGMYFIKAQAGQYSAVRKVILLK